MKLFKKKTVAQKINDSNASIAKLDKNQLNSIIGGTEVVATEDSSTAAIVVKFKGVIMS